MRYLGLLLAVLGSPLACHACSCFAPWPVCSIEMGKTAIFRGTVLGQTLLDDVHVAKQPDGKTLEWHGGGRYRVRFAVQETFSGEAEQERTVYTNAQSSACGFPFEDGAEYVVFTYADGAKGELWTSRCSRTAKLTAREENASVNWMRGWTKAAAGSEIFGSVSLPRGSGNLSVPARVTLSGPERREVAPDAQGGYSMKGLKAGEYTVSASVPNGFSTGKARQVTVGERGCAQVDWPVRYEGRVTGTVRDVDGKPVADVAMRLEFADGEGGQRYAGVDPASTDAEGKYVFTKVSPGSYVIVADHASALTEAEYPGTGTSRGRGGPIKLGASAVRDGVDLTLPRLRPTTPTRVRVAMADGSAARAGLMVFGFHQRTDGREPVRTGVTDGGGWAVLPLFPGGVYFLSVALDRLHVPCGSGPEVAAGGTAEVRIDQPEKCAAGQ